MPRVAPQNHSDGYYEDSQLESRRYKQCAYLDTGNGEAPALAEVGASLVGHRTIGPRCADEIAASGTLRYTLGDRSPAIRNTVLSGGGRRAECCSGRSREDGGRRAVDSLGLGGESGGGSGAEVGGRRTVRDCGKRLSLIDGLGVGGQGLRRPSGGGGTIGRRRGSQSRRRGGGGDGRSGPRGCPDAGKVPSV